MVLKHGASLKRQVLFRLLAVSCIALGVVAAASFWLNEASFNKAKAHARTITARHFEERLEQINQSWEHTVLRTKTLVELTRYLEDRKTRSEKMNAYFIAQSGVPNFSHIAVTDSKGSVLFKYGEGSNMIPIILPKPGDPSRKYVKLEDRVFCMFRVPVFLGPDGMGYMLLLKPLDNALMGDLSYPDTRLYLTWNGRTTASSLGNEGLGHYPKLGKKPAIVNDDHHEEIQVPLVDGTDVRGPDVPILVIHAGVERPFSAIESVIISVAMLATLAVSFWFYLGAWINRNIRRLLILNDATVQFARARKVDPSFGKALAKDPGKKDELGEHGNMTLAMMRTIEADDIEKLSYQDKLKKSNEELEQFAYIASHDLQEPLRKIASFSELLSLQYKGRLDADADRYLKYVIDGAHRMQTQIRELLEYSRIDRRGKELIPTDCNEVLNGTINHIRMAVDEAGAVITNDQLPTVKADGLQLAQVFQNLITNAVKFRGTDSPEVHISAEQRSNEWIFSVKDNGIGIAPEYVERIFIMFQRLHTRVEYPGTGLGLAICKKIVERHKGRIWVESEPGKGSTFRFSIPA